MRIFIGRLLGRSRRAGRSTIVRPPPGVSSASSVPPIPSTKPFESARPRPRPVSLSVSPRRWNGANTSSRRSARDARAAVDDAQLDAVAERARRDAARARPAGEWRTALASRFTTTRCSSTRSASTGGRSSARSSSTSPGTDAELVDAPGARRRRASIGASCTASAPACTRLTSSRFGDERRRASRGSRRRSSSSSSRCSAGSSASGVRRALTAADGGGERAAEVVAHRGEQRRAHPVGLGERAAPRAPPR